MSATIARPQGQSRAATRLATLLAVAVFINYVDRGNLATAAPVIKAELHLSATQIGVLISAFYWTYAFSQLGAGWLAERFAVHGVIAAGFALWSIATLLTGAASGFAVLFALRLLLGLGESVAFPCSSKLLAQHVPIERRGRANGAIAVGLAAGPAFGTFVGGLILARFGWRPLFVSLGALSLLWLWPWLTGPSRDLGRMPMPVAESGPSYAEIVRRRAALGMALAHFCGNYTLYFIVSWLPLYLVQDRGFSIAHMAALGGAVYVMQAVGAFLTGRAHDHWIGRGATANRVYKTTMVIGQLVAAVCLLGAVLAPPLVSSACLLIAGMTFGLGTPTLFAAAQTLAGPTATGRWVGFQNFVGNLAGITGPAITGFLVDRTGHFDSIGNGPTTVAGSVFARNSASNGGAIGNLGNDFTIVNSRVIGNHATGTDGNPGNGGNGGGISIDGQGTTIAMCGDQFVSDTGDAFGGGVFRVSYLGTEPTIIDRTVFDSNVIAPSSASAAGGLYLQGTTITMSATTISNNSAGTAGGFFIGPLSTANLTNTIIAGNTASTGLGGAIFVDGNVVGTLLNVTIADNHAPGSVSFDGGIAFGSTHLMLQNSIVADNTVGNGYNPINCGATLGDGGGNIQYPVARAGGGSDMPGALCTPTVLVADPALGALQDNGGVTETMLPAAGSPAIGIGAHCPSTDQRGNARASACTAGAVEVP